jgi:hypothetical protein
LLGLRSLIGALPWLDVTKFDAKYWRSSAADAALDPSPAMSGASRIIARISKRFKCRDVLSKLAAQVADALRIDLGLQVHLLIACMTWATPWVQASMSRKRWAASVGGLFHSSTSN